LSFHLDKPPLSMIPYKEQIREVRALQTKRFSRIFPVLFVLALLAITLFAAFALSTHSSPYCIAECGVCLHLAKLQTALRQLIGASQYGAVVLLALLLLTMGALLRERFSTSLVAWKTRMNN